MTYDPDQQTGPTPIAERSTYSDPAVRAAIREAISTTAPDRAASDLAERSNWLAEVTRRVEATNGGAGGRYVSVGVAASVAVGFATDVADAVGSDPVDRIGDHYRVEGWIDGDDSQDDYCGFCSIDGSPGAPAQRFAWPCDGARAALNWPEVIELRRKLERAISGREDETAALRKDIAELQAAHDALHLQVEVRDARIKVLEEAGRLISEGAEKTRTERDELGDKVDELEALIAHRTSWSSGRIDPTPGQITAYLKAANAVVEQGGGVMYSPTAIRAGLAAVQFALLNPPTTDGEPVAPGDVRPGDILTYTAPVSYVAGGFAFFANGHEIRLTAPGVTVTRPATPPPTEPGTVIEATVHGRTVQLTLTDDTSPDPWFVIAGHEPGFCRWVAACDLTAVRVLSTPTGDTP